MKARIVVHTAAGVVTGVTLNGQCVAGFVPTYSQPIRSRMSARIRRDVPAEWIVDETAIIRGLQAEQASETKR